MLNMQVPWLFSLLYLIILYENLLLKRKQQQQISFVKNITSICQHWKNGKESYMKDICVNIH